MKITVVGFAACPFTQRAKRTLEAISNHSGKASVNLLIKSPAEFRKWVRSNKLAAAKAHFTSPACFVGNIEQEYPSSASFLIGGASDLNAYAAANKLVPPRTHLCSILAFITLILAVAIALPARMWLDYEATKLAPFGGGFFKDMIAFGLTMLPRVARAVMRLEPPSDERLEGWHETLDFNAMGANKRLHDSRFFAENFYFWANSPSDDSFLFTIRLSFYGVNASTVIPWFHFSHNGETWDLPEDFENKTLPHKTGDERVAVAPGLGELRFDCIQPMREWKLSYSGLVRSMKDPKVQKKITAEFKLLVSPDNVFKYQLDWDELSVARAMAGKPWTRQFWRSLRGQNQERYASLGKVSGSYQFKDEKAVTLDNLSGSRDHNFGIRNWLYIHTYIWFPPVRFDEPIVIDGISYEYLTGAMTMYGSTFDNVVVGGLVSAKGEVCAWNGATPMREIAREWYDATSVRGSRVGSRTLRHGNFEWKVALGYSKYILEITQKRGEAHGLWQHSFLMIDGDFEIHEALTMWEFRLTKAGSNQVIQRTTARGLFEFGKNLVGLDESE